MVRSRQPGLLLGEWAVLGILAERPAHGFAVARRLEPEGDIGRVWSLSRPLTYRAVETLHTHGLIEAVGEEPGAAGGPRRLFDLTATGRAELDGWLHRPVAHLRDVRSELLLKLLLCDLSGAPALPLIQAQRQAFAPLARTLAGEARRAPTDPVLLWRYESSQGVVRFLDRLAQVRAPVEGA